MLIDSHCHLNLIDLKDFDNQLDNVMKAAADDDVRHFLCVCVELDDYPELCRIADTYPNVSISVGIHPNHETIHEPTADELSALAENHQSCIAIGETGLDYYRTESTEMREQQQQRFRQHIRAALASSRPLIIHTRDAAEDTLKIMAEENADKIGGVMHCFSENWDIAQRAMDMNFYISLSGIVSFKNAVTLHETARKVPLDRLLIETDAPYLAPVPYRGKQNHPALVKHVAMAVSALRQTDFETIARQTSENFQRCFRLKIAESGVMI